MRKYYHAENCNRIIKSGSSAFYFKPYSLFAGTWQGVFTTDDEREQAELAAIMTDPRSAMKEITAEEHDRCIASHHPDIVAGYQPPIPANHTTKGTLPAGERIIPSKAVVVQTPGPENQKAEVITSDPVESVDDAVIVEVVTPVIPSQPEPIKKARAASKKLD